MTTTSAKVTHMCPTVDKILTWCPQCLWVLSSASHPVREHQLQWWYLKTSTDLQSVISVGILSGGHEGKEH